MNCCSVYTNQLALLHHVLAYSKHLEKIQQIIHNVYIKDTFALYIKKKSGPSLKEKLFIILCDEIKIC